ncbi:hypothetical protein MTP99_018724 [Tenebrio molitor]|nr:hypothetical protein MTP99_014346 [Tenebrio molitor]KAJ3625162.1 hypothetical protein MTP99_018724 [Tenebrio molitor]
MSDISDSENEVDIVEETLNVGRQGKFVRQGMPTTRAVGKVGRLQEPCEFPESANILSSTSVYINEEFSKPTISICNQEDKENAGAKESRLQELYEFPESAPTSCLQLLST